MSEVNGDAIVGLAGVVIGAYLTMLAADRIASRDSRKRFRKIIRGYIYRFEDVCITGAGEGVLRGIHQESLPVIYSASLDVLEDIPRWMWRRSKFQNAHRIYRSLTYDDIETRRNDSHNIKGPVIRVHDITEGKRKIMALLEDMDHYAK